MRLITHNMLKSNVKGVVEGFPLRIEGDKVDVRESEFNAEFIDSLLPKVEWAALKEGAKCLNLEGDAEQLPATAEEAEARKGDEAFLRLTHKLLLDVHVTEGALICPETGRRFPISEGVPNMLLHEDEVA